MTFSHEFEAQSSEPLLIINSILLAVIDAQNPQALQFIITNETHRIIPYDRAILYQVQKNKISLLSISGQSSLHTLTEFYRKLNNLIQSLQDPGSVQSLSAEKFTGYREVWAEYQRQHHSTILWLPIYSGDELTLGLWVERWNASEELQPSKETLTLLSKYLLPSYGAAWGRFRQKYKIKSSTWSKYKLLLPLVALLLVSILFLVHLPLRVVALCEVVPKDPIFLTAPLQGVIEKITVKPGEEVNVGSILFKYDERLFAQELKIAQNEFSTGEAALNRALAIGINEESALTDVGILKLKLKKQKIDLELAKENYEKVEVKSPVKGTVIIDKIDSWVGKPVQVGEKIMTIADLSSTKLKIWIPENDNIHINPKVPIQVILNIDPDIHRKAYLEYIGNEVVLSDQQIPSFLAEANWEEPLSDVKPGLKGTAVLYGQEVSLFYYLIRKPWIMLRRVVNI